MEKSTEKYFKYENYRMPKTTNDIESTFILILVYVSTVKNPSLNRQSNATTNISMEKQISSYKGEEEKSYNCMEYDFDFNNDSSLSYGRQGMGGHPRGIT